MSKIDLGLVQKLRDRTGIGMMDCKKALEATGGDIEAAIELLRKKGAAVEAKRSGNATSEGIVHAYIHPGAQIGVLVEMNCETDFVARTEEMKRFAQDLCMHIAAQNPLFVTPEDIDAAFIEKEREIAREQLSTSGKPANIVASIIEGKVNKMISDICLLKQHFVKNEKLTIHELLQELIARMGENIKIRRFSRFEVGR
jgi:elongation factor Ts